MVQTSSQLLGRILKPNTHHSCHKHQISVPGHQVWERGDTDDWAELPRGWGSATEGWFILSITYTLISITYTLQSWSKTDLFWDHRESLAGHFFLESLWAPTANGCFFITVLPITISTQLSPVTAARSTSPGRAPCPTCHHHYQIYGSSCRDSQQFCHHH